LNKSCSFNTATPEAGAAASSSSVGGQEAMQVMMRTITEQANVIQELMSKVHRLEDAVRPPPADAPMDEEAKKDETSGEL